MGCPSVGIASSGAVLLHQMGYYSDIAIQAKTDQHRILHQPGYGWNYVSKGTSTVPFSFIKSNFWGMQSPQCGLCQRTQLGSWHSVATEGGWMGFHLLLLDDHWSKSRMNTQEGVFLATCVLGPKCWWTVKTGRKPREGILCSLPCLIPRVRAMSEAQPKGTNSLCSRCTMKVDLMKRSGSLALATP